LFPPLVLDPRANSAYIVLYYILMCMYLPARVCLPLPSTRRLAEFIATSTYYTIRGDDLCIFDVCLSNTINAPMFVNRNYRNSAKTIYVWINNYRFCYSAE